MNQEQTLYKFKDMGMLTGEVLLKSMLYILEAAKDKVANQIAHKAYTNETTWNKFMATDSAKDVKEFLSNEVNFERVKTYLKERQIGFSAKNLSDGKTTFAFEVKNREIVEKAFQDILSDLTTPEKASELNNKLLKTPQNMTLKEKINYYGQQVKRKVAKKDRSRTLPKKELDRER